MFLFKKKPFFLSLKWKYALVISAVLLLLHVLLSSAIYYQSKLNYENKHKNKDIKQISILEDLINHSVASMDQFVDSFSQLEIPLYESTPKHNLNSFTEISTLLDYNWSNWQLIWDFKSLSFYNPKSKQLSNWGTPPPKLEQLYQLVIKTETPQQTIVCLKQCILYIAVPILAQGKFIGVLSIAKSMAEILISFKKITNADIGIILPNKQLKPQITAITNAKKNRLLLNQFFAKKKNKLPIKQGDKFLFKKTNYHISFLSIKGNNNKNNEGDTVYVFINDINQSYLALQAEKNNIIIIGIVSLLATFILLFSLLEHSANRIKGFSKALPFLSLINSSKHSDKYQHSRELLMHQKPSKYFSDELDQLQTTTINLSYQLEQLETDRESAQQQSLWIATHDELTNLFNRHYFQTEFKQQIDTAKRYNQKLALFYLDLDQFKVINDRYGHPAGDKLLIKVANNLNELSRKTDLLCRIGGDEFVIVSPVTDTSGIIALATKINTSLNEISFKDYKTSYHVGASIGIAIYPEHGESINELLTNADLAMYKAKETGFNLYHIYNPKISYHQELNKKLDWKELIEESIINNWLNLYYQPILDLKTNKISHYECLLRVIKENGEIIMPTDFIHYAEELGLIGSIDKIVINLAIKKHLELQNTAKKELQLAINLSGQSLSNEKVKTEIKRLLSLPEVKANKIIFEITETSAVTNFNIAQSFIDEIKQLGCHFALDDFGTGFSSFFYLKNMTFDYIKIDGSFIRRIETDKEDKIFVKALSDVARALGKKTIAEFVETENIIHILKELDIDYAQGYHISKPLKNIS